MNILILLSLILAHSTCVDIGADGYGMQARIVPVRQKVVRIPSDGVLPDVIPTSETTY